MEQHTLPKTGKPFDIRERLLLFACDIAVAMQKLQRRDQIAGVLSAHLVESAVSAAANAEEADDGSSRRDFLAKERICLLELKESRLRLRVLRQAGYLHTSGDTLVQESTELIRIVAKIIHNSARSLPKAEQRPKTRRSRKIKTSDVTRRTAKDQLSPHYS